LNNFSKNFKLIKNLPPLTGGTKTTFEAPPKLTPRAAQVGGVPPCADATTAVAVRLHAIKKSIGAAAVKDGAAIDDGAAEIDGLTQMFENMNLGVANDDTEIDELTQMFENMNLADSDDDTEEEVSMQSMIQSELFSRLSQDNIKFYIEKLNEDAQPQALRSAKQKWKLGYNAVRAAQRVSALASASQRTKRRRRSLGDASPLPTSRGERHEAPVAGERSLRNASPLPTPRGQLHGVTSAAEIAEAPAPAAPAPAAAAPASAAAAAAESAPFWPTVELQDAPRSSQAIQNQAEADAAAPAPAAAAAEPALATSKKRSPPPPRRSAKGSKLRKVVVGMINRARSAAGKKQKLNEQVERVEGWTQIEGGGKKTKKKRKVKKPKFTKKKGKKQNKKNTRIKRQKKSKTKGKKTKRNYYNY
jgi:hypothetical protein